MKHFVLLLAIALLFGVAVTQNCSESVKTLNEVPNLRQQMTAANTAAATMTGFDNYVDALKSEVRNCLQFNITNTTANLTELQTCVDSIVDIQESRMAIAVEKKRYSPDSKVIAKHEADIVSATNTTTEKCVREIQCGFGKAEMKFYEDALVNEKKRYAPDANVLQRLEKTATEMKLRVTLACNKSDVCEFSKTEIKKYEEAIVTEQKRYAPDQSRINKLKSDQALFKFQVTSTCQTHEVCEVVKFDFLKARNEIAAEKKRYAPDENKIQKLQGEVEDLREGLFQHCNATEVCQFVDQDIKIVQDELAAQKKRYAPDQKIIVKLEGAITRLQEVKSNKCSGVRLLAEKTIKAARFLARLMRH